MKRDEKGNALVSLGCLIMLVPVLILFFIAFISVIGAALGMGE